MGKAGGVDIVVITRGGDRINAFKAIISISFQGGDHGIDSIIFIGYFFNYSSFSIFSFHFAVQQHADPVKHCSFTIYAIDLIGKFIRKCCTTAAAANAAVVCACHAAHKAVARGDDTAAAFPCGNIAGCNGAVVTARNAAHAAGAFQLFRIGLAVAQARGTHHLQRDFGYTALLNLTIVQADDAAHGVQHIGCARGDVIACRSSSLAQRALIGTL